MKLKNIFLIAACLIFSCGCYNSNTIYIAGILPLTGDYYFCGNEIKNGIELAISKRDTILDKKIKFVVSDDKSEHVQNINAYNKFAANKKICAVIGGGNSILSEDIAAVSQKNPLPVIVPSASVKSITEYGTNIYRCAFTDEIQGVYMANFALNELNAKTAAIFYDMDNNYSTTLAKAFSKTFNESAKVVIEQPHPNSDNDFKIQLNKIKLAKPDVLFIPDYADNAVLIIKQIRDMGIKSTILGSDTWEEVIDGTNDKSILDGIYFCSHFSIDNPDANIQNFVDEYEKKFNKKPSSFAALGFDATNILIDAIQNANSTDMNAILNAMAKTNYSGVSGKIKFDENRNPIKNITILKIEDGKNNFFKVVN
jgi:ABC-type branched-chain amino acid transport systems, periplasmic component